MILAAAVGAAATVIAAPPATAAPPPSALTLLTGSGSVTLENWKGSPGVDLNLGAYLAAERAPFEIRLKRKSYRDPIVANQIIRQGRTTRTRRLPQGMLKGFAGLRGLVHVTLTDAKGVKVVDRDQVFCPNSEGGRIRPDAPATSSYPNTGCPSNPFTLGSVWGIHRGWTANTFSWSEYSKPVKLADGKYTAKISVTKRYRDFFKIKGGTKTVKVTVHTMADDGPGMPRQRMAAKPAPPAKPNAARPTGKPSVPKGPKPDLRSLPAFGIEIQQVSPKPGDPKRDFLAFGANVWNAGPSPMVVDGFRRRGKALMDAYQYFYDAKGKQIGYSRTGTFEWDPRAGHTHWHFTDFAGYRLLNAGKKLIVRSQKEAFCLANTDAVDYTVPNANWRPEGTDLHTSCGEQTSLSLRQVLDVGSGDTYVQSLPGQSFDITGLKNGTYFIQVIANPSRRLHESNVRNNVALRKVILGGKPGARTVKVPPVGLVNAR